jgi:rhodanese-related sulfurtransferase
MRNSEPRITRISQMRNGTNGRRFVFIGVNSWLEILMAEHKGFEKLVADAKKNITEISPTDAAAKLKSGNTVIVDVREQDEWDKGHIPDAIHLSRGTIELDIEEKVPDPSTTVILHCGGGGRSALAAESLQKMGYKNVRSLAGGFKAWKAIGLPTTK